MKALVSLSLAAAAALVCSPASAQAPRTLEFAVQTTPAEPAARALTDFARNVERQTGGAVRIRLRFVAMNVASGALRAAAPVGAMLQREDVEALCPNVAAYRAPALFPDLAAADRVFQTMRPELESSCATGVTVLGWALPGPRYLYVRAPVQPTADGTLPRVALSESSAFQTGFLGAQGEGANLIPGVVVHPGERGLFTSNDIVVTTPVGMDLGALVIHTPTLNALTPEQQRAVRAAAAEAVQSLTRTLRATPLGGASRVPEGPAWTAWASASRARAVAHRDLGPLVSRMLLMLGPQSPPQTSPVVTPAPDPAAPQPSSPATDAPAAQTPPSQTPLAVEPPAAVQTPPAVEPPPGAQPPSTTPPASTAQVAAGPGIDLPMSDLPAVVVAAGYPRALVGLRPRLRRCYDPALRAATPIAGQITWDLRLSTRGSVVGIRLVNDPALTTITELTLSRCAESVLRGLRLPEIQSDTVTVRQTVVFRAR